MAKRYKQQEENILDDVTFSSEDIKELRLLLENYPTRLKFLQSKGIIVIYDFMTFGVVQSPMFIGSFSGIGGHQYQTDIPYTFWNEAFAVLDAQLTKERYLEDKEIFERTGERPRSIYFEKIRNDLQKFYEKNN